MLTLIDEHFVESIISNDPLLITRWVKEALRLHYKNEIIQPTKTYLNSSDNPYDRIIALPALIKGENGVAGIKWIGSHSSNVSHGFPRASALVVLNSIKNMMPMAILEASLLSSMRTFAISILSLNKFIHPGDKVGIIGMGRLGRLHAIHLSNLFPQIDSIHCYSKTAKFEDVLETAKVRKCNSLKEVLSVCNVLITTTSATEPYIMDEDLGEDVRVIINLSLMDFELKVLENSSYLIVDDWDQNTKAKKVFKTGVEKGTITRDKVEELGEVLFGKKTPRKGRIFINPLGMGIEDIFVAKKIHEIFIANNRQTRKSRLNIRKIV